MTAAALQARAEAAANDAARDARVFVEQVRGEPGGGRTATRQLRDRPLAHGARRIRQTGEVDTEEQKEERRHLR